MSTATSPIASVPVKPPTFSPEKVGAARPPQVVIIDSFKIKQEETPVAGEGEGTSPLMLPQMEIAAAPKESSDEPDDPVVKTKDSSPDNKPDNKIDQEMTKNWTELDKIGLGDPKKDHETVSKNIHFLKGELAALSKEIKAKVEQLKELEKDQAKKTVEDLKKVETLKAEVEDLVKKQSDLRFATVKGDELLENILRLETKKDLGLDGDKIPEGVLKIKAAGERDETADESDSDAQDESGSLPGRKGDVPETGVLGLASDFSGTTFQIMAATTGDLKSDAKKTDKMIQELLKAALSGNAEAVTWALILLDKKASAITTGIGAQTIKAMQSYEEQMSKLSSSISKLKGTEPDYNAKLAKINSEMNRYGLNRQAIANFLRDTMSMREEVGNTTKSFIQKRDQISAQLSR